MLIAFWRAFFLYCLVIFALRFMGKRQIGELQPSELVTTIMISNIAAIPIENMGTPLISGAIPILCLTCLEILSSGITLKSKKARTFIMGTPRAVIHDGQLDRKEMRSLRWSIDDLLEQLRGAGIFNIDDVDWAIVETNGKLSVLPKFLATPVNNADAHIKPTRACGPAAVVISDGEVCPMGLALCNLSVRWLTGILQTEGLAPKDIFLMSCDRSASYKIVRMEEDRLEKS